MEVHHHPQLHHKPKPWKEYFLEFVMIFLAVTLGFFAENIREHVSDTTRENEYANALYHELRDDSAAIEKLLQLRKEKESDMDFLRHYLADSSLELLPRLFYPAFTTSLYLINSYTFEPKDAILGQLRNSGSFHYFKSVELQKKMGDLCVCINNIRNRNDQEYQFFASPIKLFLLSHYDFRWIDQLRESSPESKIIDLLHAYKENGKLVKAEILNKNNFNKEEVSNMIVFYKQMLISTQTLQWSDYIRTNHNILELLRTTYSLD